jgi:hypothetical protein
LEAFWAARPGGLEFSALSLALAAEDNGRDERVGPSTLPTVEVAFARESYAPGEVGRLLFFSAARGVRLQIFRAGTEARRPAANDVMDGTPATRRTIVARPSAPGRAASTTRASQASGRSSAMRRSS